MSTKQTNVIEVRGARTHNLRNIDVVIPKHALTVITGVSGSGKSSLVFDTLALESQRLLNETYPAFVQGFMPNLTRPEVDVLTGLTPVIAVDQSPMSANPRSTVGTVSDANALLRQLFARLASPPAGGPGAYSFNLPTVSASGVRQVAKDGARAEKVTYSRIGGMCPKCEGRGEVPDINVFALYDANKSLRQGAIQVPGYTPDGWNVRTFLQVGLLDGDKPIKEYSPQELEDFLYHEPLRFRAHELNLTYEGLVPKVRRSFLTKDRAGLQPHVRAFVDKIASFAVCSECQGSRLSVAARSARLAGMSIAEVSDLPVSELTVWVEKITDPAVAPLVASLRAVLTGFLDIGLGYLSLARSTASLSAGEAQRIKMVRHLGSALTDITYVFDEPTVGLHPHDISRICVLLQQLRDKGNTVLVIEHKPQVIAIADHVIDMGPGAGEAGGTVCYTGPAAGLAAAGTLTGRHLAERPILRSNVRSPSGQVTVRNATINNLRNVDVDFPLGVLTVVSGVAGAGKSSLVHDCLARQAHVVTIDQAPIAGSSRSSPATFTGLAQPLRKVFAKANGVPASLFSANSAGACPLCKGLGVLFTDLGFLDTVTTPCDECDGRGFRAEVLQYQVAGLSIADALAMSPDQALQHFSTATVGQSVIRILTQLREVGLGYLPLGQPMTTLSGGERQRLKLASSLGQTEGILVLDEPTTGLHLADVSALLRLLDRLVDTGRTVVVVEHHLAVVAHADWVIDVGPQAGSAGGQIVFAGPPTQLAQANTLTGVHLRRQLGLE